MRTLRTTGGSKSPPMCGSVLLRSPHWRVDWSYADHVAFCPKPTYLTHFVKVYRQTVGGNGRYAHIPGRVYLGIQKPTDLGFLPSD